MEVQLPWACGSQIPILSSLLGQRPPHCVPSVGNPHLVTRKGQDSVGSDISPPHWEAWSPLGSSLRPVRLRGRSWSRSPGQDTRLYFPCCPVPARAQGHQTRGLGRTKGALGLESGGCGLTEEAGQQPWPLRSSPLGHPTDLAGETSWAQKLASSALPLP